MFGRKKLKKLQLENAHLKSRVKELRYLETDFYDLNQEVVRWNVDTARRLKSAELACSVLKNSDGESYHILFNEILKSLDSPLIPKVEQK